jgi:hypothetical protein
VMSMIPWKNGAPVGQRHMAAWVVCPLRMRSPSLEVARGGLTETLVLTKANRVPEAVTYLTVTYAVWDIPAGG